MVNLYGFLVSEEVDSSNIESNRITLPTACQFGKDSKVRIKNSLVVVMNKSRKSLVEACKISGTLGAIKKS